MLISVLAVVSPLGRDVVIHTSFYAGEQLARSLAQVVLYVYGGVLLGAIVLEWLFRWWWARLKRGAGA